MLFNNRHEAGQTLAVKLEKHFLTHIEKYRGLELVVAGIPQAGVPCAFEIARKFCCPLEIMVCQEIRFPDREDFSIGAVCSGGITVLSPQIPHTKYWRDYVEKEQRALTQKTQIREDEFYALAFRYRSSLEGKIVIVVEDGVATGMKALAALEAARLREAARVVLAAPVMSKESINQLKTHCDDIVNLYVPESFESIAASYLSYECVTNEEVVQALKESNGFHNCPNLIVESSVELLQEKVAN